MKKFKWLFGMMVITLVMTASLTNCLAMTKTENVNIDALLDNFTTSYQAGNVDNLVSLYAASIKLGTRTYTRSEIKQQYLQLFGKQKGLTISGIIIVGGRDGFKLVDANKATGTVNLQVK